MRQENKPNNSNINYSDTAYAEPEAVLSKPSMYKVVLMNDDFTPMEFVVYILQKFFHKSHEEATGLTLQVHGEGAAVCGFYTRDVAETKAGIVNDFARKSQHPLKCVFEENF
ncbi:MAG: ATP-dependent Clp protease adapter ClpS [Alphaproteobacteria bacterium CG11_big_fil_rev_8_21_14_0_20_44_7]|nr:MAG: ATP-dependent Clp protease adapter ClpS [Alphaproteobacteria bacterium CG11_big_fil_rev_8_21_14_0_20_44_7]